MFELRPLEKRPFLHAEHSISEEIQEISSFFTTQFPVLISQSGLESVNCFFKKAIQPRICVVKMEIDQGKKNLVSSKLLCSKDANLVVQIRSIVY